MAAMTDSELIDLARSAVTERLKGADARVIRSTSGPHQEAALVDVDNALSKALAEQLGIELPEAPTHGSNCADVAIQEDTDLGMHTTVVQIRQGKVLRVIGRG